MIEHSPMGIIIADAPDVTIRAVSRFGRELIGRSDSAIIGIPADLHAERLRIYRADGVTPAQSEGLPLTRATRQGDIIRNEVWRNEVWRNEVWRNEVWRNEVWRNEVWVLGRPDGTRVPILCNAGPIRDADGRISGGVMWWQDVTESERAEEEKRQSWEK